MHHWGNMLAVVMLVLALAAVLFTRYWVHQSTVGTLYSTLVESHWKPESDEFASSEQQKHLRAAAEEGLCWAGAMCTAVNVWTVVLVLLVVLMLVYHFRA